MTRSARTLEVVALTLSMLLALAPAATAQTDADRENAQALYKAGNDAREAGDMVAAASKYKVAYALVSTPLIGLALGKAELALGQLIEARQSLLSVDRIPQKPHESARTTAARTEASTLAAEVAPRIPTVTLKMSLQGAPPPTLTIDGVKFPDVALNAPLRLNPGSHVAVAALDEARAEAHFDLAEGSAIDVNLDYPARPSVEPPVPVVAPPSATFVPPVRVDGPAPRRSLRAPAYGALGTGAAGVAVTAVFGALALDDRSSLLTACSHGKTSCPPSAQADINSLHVNSVVSDVGLGVAIAALGTGAVLLLLDRRGSIAPPEKAAAVQPWVSLGAAGIRGSF